ncbi:MAG: transcriptional regulator [Ponticaulis sp.]|nr:transcriptional regulator [Ponticaulis sp.]|tara:strand:- start:11093 stop:11449 length:357 start_codon:yes stop_codon:yes gene_type:complete
MPDLAPTLNGLSALAQDIRLRAFRMLMEAGPAGLPAGKISSTLQIAPNKLSAHLNVLSQANLVSVERQGRHMIYSANIEAVASLLSGLVETCCNGNPGVCTGLSEFMERRSESCCEPN